MEVTNDQENKSPKKEIQEDEKNYNNITKIESLESLQPVLAVQNNAENFLYISDIPEICKTEPCMLGVDEAGRGPVLGPMVYGIAFCPISQVEHLTTLGCADSKQLTEEKRDEIFNDLTTKEYANTTIGWAVEVISPNIISQSMLRRTKHSLNAVSMESAIDLIQKAIDMGVNIAEIYVDTVGPPETYQQKLLNLFPDFQITVAKKADSTYPIVSAASICAKVTRDHALKVWRFPEGLPAECTWEQFGSGYPGDPKTKSFLEENIDPLFGFPRLVRFSWSTATNMLQNRSFDVQFDEDGELDQRYRASKASIKKFFKSEIHHERHEYFKDRFLNNVSNL